MYIAKHSIKAAKNNPKGVKKEERKANIKNKSIKPELNKMHIALIRVIDQTRMLDNDMIRLQQKVNVVLEYREQMKLKEEGKNEKKVKK